MGKQRGFTLIELLTVISVIVLLISLLIPGLQRARQQANTVVCRAGLRQWGLYFSMYTEENKDRFPLEERGTGGEWLHWWRSMRPFYRDCNDVLLCPAAKKPVNPNGEPDTRIAGGRSLAWGRLSGEYRYLYGSFGLNLWVFDNECTNGKCWHQDQWRTALVKGANTIPVLADCLLPGGLPRSQDGPPPFSDVHAGVSGACWMSHFCIDRHNGHVDTLFADWSVKKVGLKELWTLKWHRGYKTTGPWTKAGGVVTEEWPQWMRNFKDY
ncbi:MAG: type II secretion system protein [Planctomycetota bacterium]|jgi:prepilin-type N-terminal cleavage/methylation domain-containing protein/prepilin-type processing-associated H-X9-DG protein